MNFDGARALAASEQLTLDEDLPSDFAERWCKRTIQGVQRIADWVGAL